MEESVILSEFYESKNPLNPATEAECGQRSDRKGGGGPTIGRPLVAPRHVGLWPTVSEREMSARETLRRSTRTLRAV